MQFDFLPNTLPYVVSEVLERFSEIPQGLRHGLRFAIPGALDLPTSLPEVSGRRITLSFEGATAEDQAVIEEHGGIFRTPPYLIEVKPVLRINGNRAAEGSAMNAGIYVPFNIEHHQPGEVETFDHHIITGSFNAIGITTGKVRPEFLTIGQVEVSEEPYISKMLHSLVMKYQNEDGQTKQILNDTMKMKSKTYIDEALVSTRQEIHTVMGGIPMSFDLSGFMIDAKAKVIGLLAVDGYDKKKQIDFMMVSGLEGSYQENRVFEDNMYWVAGLSAVKGLQVLKAMGINVTELEPPQTYSNPNLPEKVIEDINNALNMGWKVIVPETAEGLAVTPDIKYDPNTGSAGYMIATAAGGYSGYADRDWPIVDQAVVDFLLGQRFYTYWDWEVYSPEDGKTVLLGDVFDAFLRMTIKWISGETEETLVLENVFGTNIPLKIRIATGPGISENGQPSQWWNPGSYTLSFNRERKFGFNVWGPVIDLFNSDKYLAITTDEGKDTIKTPLNITYSIKQYPDLIIGQPSIKIFKWPADINHIPVRTILLPEIGENKTTIWDGKDDGGNIVEPSSYDIVIEALGIKDGQEKTIQSQKHKVIVFKVELVDDNGNPIEPRIIGEHENFVSWKTLQIKYRITPEIPDSAYDWDVAKGTASAAGHSGLGTPSPENRSINKGGKVIGFNPRSADSYKAKETRRAKPLAFELRFKVKDTVLSPFKPLATYKIEQSYRNAIREEYKVYDVPESYFPNNSDFDGTLLSKNLVNCAYDPADIPKGEKLNSLAAALPENEYRLTSSYRNPYRNHFAAESTVPTSRHVWSGAFDLVDKNGEEYTEELKSLWISIKDKTEFGQVLVESRIDRIYISITNYLTNVLKRNIVPGSVLIKSMQSGIQGTYVIVWSKQKGWQWVKFDWQEIMSDGSVKPHIDDNYIFTPEDWGIVARNLHAQDRTSSGWGW